MKGYQHAYINCHGYNQERLEENETYGKKLQKHSTQEKVF